MNEETTPTVKTGRELWKEEALDALAAADTQYGEADPHLNALYQALRALAYATLAAGELDPSAAVARRSADGVLRFGEGIRSAFREPSQPIDPASSAHEAFAKMGGGLAGCPSRWSTDAGDLNTDRRVEHACYQQRDHDGEVHECVCGGRLFTTAGRRQLWAVVWGREPRTLLLTDHQDRRVASWLLEEQELLEDGLPDLPTLAAWVAESIVRDAAVDRQWGSAEVAAAIERVSQLLEEA